MTALCPTRERGREDPASDRYAQALVRTTRGGGMRALGLVVASAICLGVTSCGSDKTAAVMPDVTGKKLDVAKSAIGNAGYKDDVKVEGGGVFGVVNESNWEV